jgi:hypothetical protein
LKARGFAIQRNQNLAALRRQYGIDRKHWDRIFSGMDTDHYVYSAEPVLRAGMARPAMCRGRMAGKRCPGGALRDCRWNAHQFPVRVSRWQIERRRIGMKEIKAFIRQHRIADVLQALRQSGLCELVTPP